ncbi:S8 family serine peptidase [Roseofilum capinflatum]|uniref:S8 family serine peptidase n=1 Tax=Roseofilum capinflatum BLCC-M114 TaxID=3022440 RepID=A0ABT7B075_9CYAN|nr:S8 family serine peptidase [Roseofilum capinflatum]MDJ1172572.1 S8 family serine peptidase [Roseofilum capinflatum BLCC-M114]
MEIDYIFDGGGYKGELAIFSLDGMDEFEPGSEDFIQEAANRSLSSSEQGHVVISDADEGARFSGNLGERDQNAGEYLGVKSFNMRSGDTFGVMLVPNKTVARVFDNPGLGGSGRPLFSMVTSNPYEGFHVGQIADVTGDGSTFVMEDIRMDGKTDSDYNDIIFQIRGAKGKAALMDEVLGEGEDWRETELGKGIIEYVKPYVTPDAVDEVAGDLVEDIETLLEFLDKTTEPEAVENSVEENLGEEAFTTDVVEPEVVEQESEDNLVEEGEDSETENTVEPEVVQEATTASEENSDEEEPAITVEENNSVAEEEEVVVAETTETENGESSDDLEENAVEAQEIVEEVEGENTDTEPVELEPTVKQELVARLETLTSNLEEIDTEESSITQLKETVTTLADSLTRNSEELSQVQEVATTRLVNRLEAVAQQWVSGGEEPTVFEFAETEQPLVGVIDTGFSGDNPDIDYSRITLGTDYVEGDENPLLSEGEGNEHGTHILGIIGATQDNGIGIDGVNDTAPLWVSRAIGSGQWAESLMEFVDAAQESGQPNAVVNLSLDLTQVDAEGNVTTRYELTPEEREAIEYARQNGVLIVAAAGNDGDVMSVLGQASQEFDNILTVGAAEQVNPRLSVAEGFNRAEYSSYGQGLDLLAPGGTTDNPVVSTVGEGVGTMAGTSVATAKVTGAVSQVWAANPELSYRQVVEILKETATDLDAPNGDETTGAGLLNLLAAVQVAKETKPEVYEPEKLLAPLTWGGEGTVTPQERAVSERFWKNGKYYDWVPYQMKWGDTLNAIAQRTLGSGAYDYYMWIAQKNGIRNPNYIVTGDWIQIPQEVPASPVVVNPVIEPKIPVPVPPPVSISPAAKQSIEELYQQNKTTLGQKTGEIIDLGNGFLKQNFEGGYIIWNGQKALVYFLGTGTPKFPKPTPEPKSLIYGSLVQGSGAAVYYIDNGYRRDIPDPETFYLMGFEVKNINRIPDSQLNTIPLGRSMPSRKNGALVQGFGSEVYYMENGYRRHIPDAVTFNVMELNWGGIQRVSTEDLNDIPLGNPLPSQRDGALLHGDGPAVYITENGYRRLIPDPETFKAMGLDKADIQFISESSLQTIALKNPLPSRKDGTLLQGFGSEVYYMENGDRRLIPDGVTFNTMGLDLADIEQVSNDDINAIPLGEPLPSQRDGALLHGDGPAVYITENGYRRLIPDPETFDAIGLDRGEIQFIAESSLQTIPLKNPLPSRKNGSLVQGSGSEIYYMESGFRRLIPDAETFDKMGLDMEDIQHVSDADGNAIPLGQPLPSLSEVTQDNKLSPAQQISFNQTTQESVNPQDVNDIYTFTVDRPQYVRLELDGLSDNANIELIEDVNHNQQLDIGEVLGRSDKAGSDSEAFTRFLTPGQYYVRVASGTQHANTDYNLSLRGWLNVQPDNGPQPVNRIQGIGGQKGYKIDSVYFSDVTGDDQADAVVVNNWGTTTRRSNSSEFLRNETWTEFPHFGSHRTFFADVNGDGKADAIAVNDFVHPDVDAVYVKLSNGSEFLETQKWTEFGYGGKYGTFFADVTGDGKADAIVVNDEGVTVRRSDGTRFLWNEPWTTNGYGGKYGTFFADVTGDGKADAIVVNDEGVTVRRSDGTRFLWNEPWTTNGYGGKYGTFFADVTGDGKADAIVVNDEGVTVRRSDGTRFLWNEPWTTNGYGGKYGTFFADVTGDGKADAIVVNDEGVTVRRSNGSSFSWNEPWTTNGYGGEGGPGTIVKGSGPEVYFIDGIVRRHIPDAETLSYVGVGYITSQNSLSDEDLNSILLGDPLPSRKNGALVKGSGPEVYYMEKGQRRHIPDAETFEAMGLDWGAIQYVSERDLNDIPLGLPVPSVKDSRPSNPNPGYIYNDNDYLKALYQDNVGNRLGTNAHNHDHIIREALDTIDGDGDGRVHALVGGEVVSAKNGQHIKDWKYNGEVAIYNKELNKTFIYWHFAPGSVNTSLLGQTINAGDFIGREGNTGSSYGAHTHVQIHNGRGPNYAFEARLHIPSVFQDAVRKGLVKFP